MFIISHLCRDYFSLGLQVRGLIFRGFFLALFTCNLSACSSSGGSVGLPSDVDSDSALSTFETYEALGLQLTRDVVGEAPTLDLGISGEGSVVYIGVAGFGFDTVRLAGSAEITVDFQSNVLSGQVSQIISSDGIPLEGTLNLNDLFFDREVDVNRDFSVSGDLTGELTSDQVGQLTVDAELFGDFFENGAIFSGVVEGFVASEDDIAPIINGVIIAANSD